ncbi:hypothetical protein L9F63_018298, partial [Diploptera punctata]
LYFHNLRNTHSSLTPRSRQKRTYVRKAVCRSRSQDGRNAGSPSTTSRYCWPPRNRATRQRKALYKLKESSLYYRIPDTGSPLVSVATVRLVHPISVEFNVKCLTEKSLWDARISGSLSWKLLPEDIVLGTLIEHVDYVSSPRLKQSQRVHDLRVFPLVEEVRSNDRFLDVCRMEYNLHNCKIVNMKEGTADIIEAQQLTRKEIFHIIKNTLASQTVDIAALILEAHMSLRANERTMTPEEALSVFLEVVKLFRQKRAAIQLQALLNLTVKRIVLAQENAIQNISNVDL